MTDKLMQALDLFLVLLLPVLPSILVAVAPHPSELERSVFRTLLLVLGRISVLRHGSAPGTLHLPLTAQPAPRPELAPRLAPPVRVCPECSGAPEQVGGKVLHDAGCGSVPPRIEPPTLRDFKPLALLVVLVLGAAVALPGCTMLTPPRKATAAALKNTKERAGKFKAWAATEEQAIIDSVATREEARGRLDGHRRAVDYCAEEVIRPSLADLREVGKTLAADPEPPAPAAAPAGGGR